MHTSLCMHVDGIIDTISVKSYRSATTSENLMRG